MTTAEKSEHKRLLKDLEEVTFYYEKKLARLERKGAVPNVGESLPERPSHSKKKSVAATIPATEDFFHDIEVDHDLTPAEQEKIRHDEPLSFKGFFRSLLMANEPSQRIHS